MSIDPASAALANRASLKMNYQPGNNAGTILSPHLETITTGSMFIALDNPTHFKSVHEPLTGRIKINLSEAFEATKLTVTLIGFLRSHFNADPKADQFGKAPAAVGMLRLAKTLISISYTIHEFEEGIYHQGMSEYPFTLTLPKEVAEVVMLQFKDNNLSKTFYLKAQMVPRDKSLFADLQDEVSMLRTDCALYLYKPPGEGEELKQEIGHPSGNINAYTSMPSLHKQLEVRVGGVAGIGSSQAKSVISLEKLRFMPGERIRVKIEHDNSECKKPVKSFKLKLLRKVMCFSGKKTLAKPVFFLEEYLMQKKFDGCAERVRENRTIEFELPVAEKTVGNTNSLHPNLRPLVKLFSNSADNALFTIAYEIQVFVKHLSKLEFGMGNFVTFPIEVQSQALEVPALDELEGEWMTSQNLHVWQPNYVHPRVSLWQTPTEVEGTYISMS